MSESIQKSSKKASKPSKGTFQRYDKNKYQGRRFVVTIHGAKPDNCPILELLKQQFQKDEYTVVAVAYETGQQGVHPHWQIYLELERRVSNFKSILTTVLKPLGKEDCFHVEKAKGTQSANLNYVYAVRKQHELGWVQYAKGHNVPWDYCPRGCENLLWLHRNMKPWQREITDRVTGTASYRDILYIHEPVGNTGKTYLSKYLHYFHGAIITGGSASDMKHAISRWKEITGAFPVIIIFDIARSDRLNLDSYKAIEQIKNGLFFTGKYDSGMVASLRPPHVVLFSNSKPVMQYMSQDRWCVRAIDPVTKTLVQSV